MSLVRPSEHDATESRQPDSDSAWSGGKYDLLDYMFTISISIGLLPELLQRTEIGIKGVISEDWLLSDRWPNQREWFDLGVLLLGVLVLTLSWAGYRISVTQQRPHLESVTGVSRFVLDILLVALYGFILIRFQHFGQVLVVVTIILIIYAIWDIVKVVEYRAIYRACSTRSLLREFVWWPSVLTSYGLALMISDNDDNRLMALMVAILIVILPRILKISLPRAQPRPPIALPRQRHLLTELLLTGLAWLVVLWMTHRRAGRLSN